LKYWNWGLNYNILIGYNFDMTSEGVPLEEQVESLINYETSLNELLGEDWKERSIFSSLDDVLTEDQKESIEKRKEISIDEASSDIEVFSAELNTIFQNKGKSFEATIIENSDGEQEVFISGTIGKDKIFQIVSNYLKVDNLEGDEALVWSPTTMGIVSEEGSVFMIDPLLKRDENEMSDMAFIEIGGRDYRRNMQVSLGKNSEDIIILLPETTEQMGILAHELGHLFRARDIKERGIEEAFNASLSEFKKISETGLTYNNEADLTNYETRKIKATEERGAWAVGLSILREVGKETGIECGSDEAIKELLSRSERALGTYDSVPYSLSEQLEDKMIPVFSQAKKAAARVLHDKKSSEGVSYQDIPSFDNKTGENIANDPEKIETILSDE
jgi:hypothetical protein